MAIDRRRFLARAAALASALPYARIALGSAALAQPTSSPPRSAPATPTADQLAWQNLEMGLFINLAPNTWQDTESDNLTTPLSEIDPKALNTDEWAEMALRFGAQYVVFDAKHQGGFCMWQTHTTEYSIRNTPWKNGKGDVLADISASCRRYGLKLGVYVCPRDDHFGATTGGRCKTPALQAQYDTIYRQQLTEVFSGYGELVEIWFDGSTVTPVGDLIRRYQPHAMIFQSRQATIRWVGNENGFAPYPCWNGIDAAEARSGTATALNSDPDGSLWRPSEADVSTRRPNWFWSTKNAAKVLTEEQLLSIYYRSVGRGVQLLLSIPPNREGRLPEQDCAAVRAFGDEIQRRFSKPLATASGDGHVLLLSLPPATGIDTVILQEDIAFGERVREYRLEGRSGAAWRILALGSAIGHKRIQPVAPTTVDAVRLVITRSVDTPRIRALSVFATKVAPPSDWNAPAEVWAANLVGDWADHVFSLNLSAHIDAARQYRLHFVPQGGSISSIRDIVLKLQGIAAPAFVKSAANAPDDLILDITAMGQSVEMTGRVEGAARGQILLQKL
jgi:alpha-L-fucosidase